MAAAALAVTDELVLPLRAVWDLAAAVLTLCVSSWRGKEWEAEEFQGEINGGRRRGRAGREEGAGGGVQGPHDVGRRHGPPRRRRRGLHLRLRHREFGISGQIELFTHVPVLRNFVEYLKRKIFTGVFKVKSSVLPDMFKVTYESITKGNPMWNELPVSASTLYPWGPTSTYIHEPPYFQDMTMTPPRARPVKDAYCLLKFGDSITTDHISPAGSIHPDNPAAKFLKERSVERKDFNSYGSRRGNDEIMARGTFANIRLANKFLKGEVGAKTIHVPSGEKLAVFDAAMGYVPSCSDMDRGSSYTDGPADIRNC